LKEQKERMKSVREEDLTTKESALVIIKQTVKGFEEKQKAISAFSEETTELTRGIATKREELSELSLLEERRNSVKKQIEGVEQQKTQEEAKESSYPQMIEEQKADVEKMETKIKTKRASYEALVVDCQYYEFWVEAFGTRGIRSHLLKKVVPYLTLRARKYLDILASGDIELKFSVTEKSFDIEVNNRFGGEKYKNNSSGERQRIDLAVSLALQDLCSNRSSNSFNLLALDEVLVNLDSVGIESVMDLLKELEGGAKTILFATNDERVAELVPNQITVVKKDGISRLVV